MSFSPIDLTDSIAFGNSLYNFQRATSDGLKGHHHMMVWLDSAWTWSTMPTTPNPNSASNASSQDPFARVAKQLSFLGLAGAIGGYAEYGDRKKFAQPAVVYLSKNLHLFVFAAAAYKVAKFIHLGHWIGTAALTSAFTIRYINGKVGSPIDPFLLDQILSVSSACLRTAMLPSLLDIRTWGDIYKIATIVWRYFNNKKYTSTSDWKTHNFKKSHSTSGKPFADYLLISKQIDLTKRENLRVNQNHIRPFFPKLIDEKSDILELKKLFYSVDWSANRRAVYAQLKNDRKYLDTHASHLPSEKDFYSSAEWIELSKRFDHFMEDIVSKRSFGEDFKLQEEMEYYCRYLTQEIGKLLIDQKVEAVDRLLDLAVAAGNYCSMGQSTAIQQVFSSLSSSDDALLSSLDRLLYNKRCLIFDSLYSELVEKVSGSEKMKMRAWHEQKGLNKLKCRSTIAKIRNMIGDWVGSLYFKFCELDSVHTSNNFRAILTKKWGINSVGSHVEIAKAENVFIKSAIWSLEKLSGFKLTRLYTPQSILDDITDGFENRSLSQTQLFTWMRQKIIDSRSTMSEVVYEDLLEKLASIDENTFFDLPTPREASGNSDKLVVDRRLIALLALDLGYLDLGVET